VPQPALIKIGKHPLGGRVAEMHVPRHIHFNDGIRVENEVVPM